MPRTILAMIIITASGFVFARGLRAWAVRDERGAWLPAVLQGSCGVLAGGAYGSDSPIWFALGTVGILGAFVMQWRMRADG